MRSDRQALGCEKAIPPIPPEVGRGKNGLMVLFSARGAQVMTGLVSTAIWQGVPFRSLLDTHGGAQANAHDVAFSSVDGYTVSQSLDVVLTADVLPACRLNGAELPMRHRYPVRALLPGHFGEDHPKWLTRIELSEQFVGGLSSDQD